jgi:hypothetical protein
VDSDSSDDNNEEWEDEFEPAETLHDKENTTILSKE